MGGAPGDELLEGANLVFDQRLALDADPETAWPWLVQLGKRRAGWYLPAAVERLLPPGRRALRRLEPRFQALAPGDRIPDYGGPHEWLEVTRIDPPHLLVFRTERRGRPFTWALVLSGTEPGRSELRLRFRGQVRSRGATRRGLLLVGGFFDTLTGRLMVAGLNERLSAGNGTPSS